MKVEWIKKTKMNDKLIIFFNGWSMGYEICNLINSQSYDLLLFYDYRDFNISVNFDEIFAEYADVILISWSFGVFVASVILKEYQSKFSKRIAINGTSMPIDDKFGIPVNTFQGTLDSYSKTTKLQFLKRMCGKKEYFLKLKSFISLSSIEKEKDELSLLHTKVKKINIKLPLGFYNFVIIGNYDKIFPVKNQLNYWNVENIKIKLLNIPHFPFFTWKNWDDILQEI